ncbi:hypothetical protein ACSS6W_005731 [Trichoderma asperelloides]
MQFQPKQKETKRKKEANWAPLRIPQQMAAPKISPLVAGPHATSYQFSSPTTRLNRKLVMALQPGIYSSASGFDEAFGCNGPVEDQERRPKQQLIAAA